jgi:hypothetical protein
MKKITLTLLILVCSYLASAQTVQLKKYSSDYISAMLGNKPELISPYLGDSVRLMPEFQKTVIGKGNALLYNRALLKRFEVKEMTRETIEVLDLGKRVVELGMFTMVLKFKGTDKEYRLQGKYQEFWQVAEAGSLTLVTAAWNYNHPVDIAGLLRFPEVPVTDVAMEAHLPVNSNISFELAALNHFQEMVITQHDGHLWLRFFTDDTKYIYSGNPPYSGKQEVGSFLDEHVKGLPIFEKLDIRNDRIDHLGKYVVEYASHTAIVRNGDFSGVFTGKNVNIWRREADGSLKIFREMAMYD